MTMLDRMRRHKGSLKWVLFAVVLTFIAFYIPEFVGTNQAGGTGLDATVAEVNGDEISLREYRQQLNSRLQMYRGSGSNITPEMVAQLGIDRQVLQELITQRAMSAEARRIGLSVNDAELRTRILEFPAFQENGQFIGEKRYRAMLRSVRPPMTPTDFEDGLRSDILRQKLHSAVTGWITVTDAEVDEEYRRRNEKAKIDVIAFPADAFRQGLTASDEEAAKYFADNKATYRIGEKRKVKYLLVDTTSLRATIVPTPAEIQQHYQTNIQQFMNPEQVRASHILLKTEGKDEATVKKLAESVLKQAKAPGADFAALATRYSEDDGSKVRGGDLNFFGKGQMVSEFETIAFAQAPGQISDLVKTQFGFHIIKVTEKKAAGTRPLDEVKDQIAEQLKWERAQAQVRTLSERLGTEITSPADLDTVAQRNRLTVKETNFFSKDEAIPEFGPSPQVSTAAFAMETGTVSEALRLPQGVAFITVTGKQEPRDPKLDEVKERVKQDVITKKAIDAAKTKATEVAATLKTAPDMAAAAKAAGREVKTSEALPRGTVWPEAGISGGVDRAAFSLPAGTISDAITTATGAVIVKVLERTPIKPEELATARQTLKSQLESERKERFFESYMAKAKDRVTIKENREAIRTAMSGIS